jgi:uncharacterized protein YndB with AHSA1/START domain
VSATDGVTVTTVVRVDPVTAFRVFTDDIDRWWRRGARFRPGLDRRGVLRFAEGRLVERYDEPTEGDFEVGRVLAWEPAARLVFEWRGRDFGDGEVTEVEVVFEAVREGTRVTLVHRGWDVLPSGHPARHGLEGEAFASMVGLYWADLLVSFQRHAGGG